jgi:hypothetical protein
MNNSETTADNLLRCGQLAGLTMNHDIRLGRDGVVLFLCL